MSTSKDIEGMQAGVCAMESRGKGFVTAVILSSLALAHEANAQSKIALDAHASATAATVSTDIPPAPRGKSTVFGGEIRELDPVRDQMTLRVYGEHPMKILFDERTQVYRDGQRVSLRALKVEERASVQTTLDGTKLFALSVHMLSNPDQGEYEGRVVSFNPADGELAVASGRSRETIKVVVQGSTSLVRKGQAASATERANPSDLVAGTLISVKFGAAGKDVPTASEVEILAVPGSQFVFSGNVTSLDLHAGSLEVVDPRDDRSYQVSFNPVSLPAAEKLRVGDNVRVVTQYNGLQYVATDLTKN
jgi:hypothetical protein